MKRLSFIFLLVTLVPFAGCSSETEESYDGPVAAKLEFQNLDKADMVGCAAGGFSPDGKKDLHFRLTLEPASVGDIAGIEIVRQGSHSGIWDTGTINYALGVTGIGSETILGKNARAIRAKEYDPKGLDLFACDDGATGVADLFVANLKLIGGKSYSTPPIALAKN